MKNLKAEDLRIELDHIVCLRNRVSVGELEEYAQTTLPYTNQNILVEVYELAILNKRGSHYITLREFGKSKPKEIVPATAFEQQHFWSKSEFDASKESLPGNYMKPIFVVSDKDAESRTASLTTLHSINKNFIEQQFNKEFSIEK